MKKIICLLLAVCILLCTTACQGEAERPQGSESTGPTESRESKISTENKQGEEADQMRILTLEKALHTYYEWADDYDGMLVRSEHSCVTLGQADTDAYPEMAEMRSRKTKPSPWLLANLRHPKATSLRLGQSAV